LSRDSDIKLSDVNVEVEIWDDDTFSDDVIGKGVFSIAQALKA